MRQMVGLLLSRGFSLVFSILLSLTTHAEYFPSRQIADLKDVPILTEEDGIKNLKELFAPGKTLLLIPGYYSCTSACPLIIENLRRVLSNTQDAPHWQVVFLSFNSADQGNNVRVFRKHHQVPAGWALATIQREVDAKELLESFNYRFQKTNYGYDHPNSAYVFSPKNKTWSGIIAGTSPSANDFKKALQDAEIADRMDPWTRLQRSALDPASLIIYGFIMTALGLSFALLAIIFSRNRTNVTSPPA